MATSQDIPGGHLSGFVSGADFSAKQFYFCKISAAGVVAIPNGATDQVLGVICNAPASGYGVDIQYLGVAKIISAGTITVGDLVGTDNAGKGVTKTADADKIAGIALATAAAGDIIPILLTPGAQRGG